MKRSFRKELSSLDEIFEFVGEFAGIQHLNPELIESLDLVVEEIFVNMVKYNSETKNDVQIDLEVEDRILYILMVDRDVHSFDVSADRDVEIHKPLHERKAGGLGLHLVKTIMDDVIYEYRDGASRIKMIKRLEA